MALNVSKGDKVITSPLTFAASANCILYCGGDVEFADIDPKTLCIDPNKVEDMLRKNTAHDIKGIIPVDFAGYPVNMEDVRSLADKYGVWILEDSCHAPGASFTDSRGKKQQSGNGEFSDLSIFSFHPVKHITTGEGGMITSNNLEKIEKILKLRIHGVTKRRDQLIEKDVGGWYYEMQDLGYNYRITDFQCALGISQLKRADTSLKRRQEIANRYLNAFSGYDFIRMTNVPQNIVHAWHLFVIQIPRRRDLYHYLQDHGIYTQVHYIPVHLQPYYKNLGWNKGDFPITEDYYEHCLSLPMYPSLKEEEQEYVIEKVKSFYKI
jgi:dTDP-4-amino-4,6-dideoxygalactose transaminase